MKNIKKIIALIVAITSIMVYALPAYAIDVTTGKFIGNVSTNSGPLNVRDQPGTYGNITSSLPHNSSYYFAGYYQDENPLWADSWLFVYEQGDTTAPTGFVKAKYITWLPSYEYSSDCFTTTVEVTPGQFVHLREKPSTTATSIGHLHNGDIVLVLKAYNSPVNGWTHIATSQGTGWIKTNFLHIQG